MKKPEMVTWIGSANHDNLHRTSKDALKTGRQGLSSHPPCPRLFQGFQGEGEVTHNEFSNMNKP